MPALDLGELAQAGADLDLEFIVLFGSRARGSAREESDVDLAVMPSSSTPGGALDVLRVLAHRLKRSDLDLVWLPGAPWLLEWEVSRHGQLVEERRPGSFESYRRYTVMRRADCQAWRRRKRDYVDRFLKGDMTLDILLVEDRIVQMARYLRELDRVFQAGAERFRADALIHHAGERLLELLVECAVAVNTEVAQVVAGIPPSDYDSSFFSMYQVGWIVRETAHQLADCASLRNRLVHQYQKVDIDDLYRVLESSVPHWRRYVQAVRDRLDAYQPDEGTAGRPPHGFPS